MKTKYIRKIGIIFIFLVSIFLFPVKIQAEEYSEDKFLTYTNYNINDIIDFLYKDAFIYQKSEEHKILFISESIAKNSKADINKKIKDDFYDFINSLNKENIMYNFIYTKYNEYLSYIDTEINYDEETLTFLEFLMQTKQYQEWGLYFGTYKTDILELFLDTYVFSANSQKILKNAMQNENTEQLDTIVAELQNIADNSGYSVGQLNESIVNYYMTVYNSKALSEYSGFDNYFTIEQMNFNIANEISNLVERAIEYENLKTLYKEFYMMSSFDIFIGLDNNLIQQYINSMENYEIEYKENIEIKYKFYNLLKDRILYENKEINIDTLKNTFNNFKEFYTKWDNYYEKILNVFDKEAYSKENIEEYQDKINSRYSVIHMGKNIVSAEYSTTTDENIYTSIPIVEKKSDNMLLVYIITIFIILAIGIVLFLIIKKNKENGGNQYYEYYD